MVRIKLCGLKRAEDISAANSLKPEYIGFVFAEKSSRRVTSQQAEALKMLLNPDIKAVGVFVNEDVKTVARLLNSDVIDIAQLHGAEEDSYINELKALADKPVIKAFQVKNAADIAEAQKSRADFVLLDSGKGSGRRFNWELIRNIDRPYFLAGGLDTVNIAEAVKSLRPYAVDVSSGIETDGFKDIKKMTAFVNTVRKEDLYE